MLLVHPFILTSVLYCVLWLTIPLFILIHSPLFIMSPTIFKLPLRVFWFLPLIYLCILSAAWRVSLFTVFRIRVFPHSDWIRNESKYGKIRTRKSPNYGHFLRREKYVNQKNRGRLYYQHYIYLIQYFAG